jgi:pyruvate carboxylase
MYPRVFTEYADHRRKYADVSSLPTPAFFYGPEEGDELYVDIERGKSLVVRLLAVGEANEEGERNVFFELNGQPRTVKVADDSLAADRHQRLKAEDGNPLHIAAPMPGLVVSVAVAKGKTVSAGDRLLTIEAMKMETAVYTDRPGKVSDIIAPAGTRVDTKDLLILLED